MLLSLFYISLKKYDYFYSQQNQVFHIESYTITNSTINDRNCKLQGVTYCGESKASTLTMGNVPWHEEVVRFVQELTDMLDGYEIAAEHEHSNCLLVANTKVCYRLVSF